MAVRCILLAAILLALASAATPMGGGKSRLETKMHATKPLAATTKPTTSPSPLELFVSAFRSSMREGLSGGAAGFVQVITMMWLRTTVSYQYRYGVSTTTALAELYAQGGVMRFYRGVTYAIVQAPLCRFGSVAANEISNILVGVDARGRSSRGRTSGSSSSSTSSRNESSSSSGATGDYLKIVLAATLGSALSTVFRVLLMPLDTCKTVLQVDGAAGFRALMHRVALGDVGVLFQGTAATIVATWVGHSWFLVHNWLDRMLVVPPGATAQLWRAAFIGFAASALSDGATNFIKVVKTVKQAVFSGASASAADGRYSSPTYADAVRLVVRESGYAGLFGRGLGTRIVSNGLQSMLFTVLWRRFQAPLAPLPPPAPVAPPPPAPQAHTEPGPGAGAGAGAASPGRRRARGRERSREIWKALKAAVIVSVFVELAVGAGLADIPP